MANSIGSTSASEETTVAGIAKALPIVLETSDDRTGIYEIDPLTDQRWKEFTENHDQASVFHSVEWLTALHNVYGYDPVVVTTSPPEAALTNGVVFCRLRSWLTGPRFVSSPFSDHCETLVRDTEELDYMLIRLKRYVEEGWKYFEIRPVFFEPSARTGLRTCMTYRLHRLDLNPSAEELFQKFHQSCVQRKIRRAERERLKYEEGNSDALLRKFYRMHVATRRRKSLPPQPLAWFQGLVAAFGKSLKIRVASYGDFPVASILTLSHKKAITYKYGCSDPVFNKLGGMALLLWRTIQEGKDQGYQELNLGRSDCDNLGLIAFKDHWGAVSTVLSYWKYPHEPATRPPIWQNKLVRRVTRATPEFALVTLGRLFYRHIG